MCFILLHSLEIFCFNLASGKLALTIVYLLASTSDLHIFGSLEVGSGALSQLWVLACSNLHSFTVSWPQKAWQWFLLELHWKTHWARPRNISNPHSAGWYSAILCFDQCFAVKNLCISVLFDLNIQLEQPLAKNENPAQKISVQVCKFWLFV